MKSAPLSFCLIATLCTAAALAQTSTDRTPSAEATPEATTTAPVAYVYVQTATGVNVYDATAAGKLTLVKGSAFADTGEMAGSNGSYFVSVGTNYLHTYTIESDGGVGKQVSEINPQDHIAADCGNTTNTGGVLDHTGKYFYVTVVSTYPSGSCSAQQAYKINSR